MKKFKDLTKPVYNTYIRFSDIRYVEIQAVVDALRMIDGGSFNEDEIQALRDLVK